MKRTLLFLLLSPDPADGGSAPATPPAEGESIADKVLSSSANEDDASELVKAKRELDETKKTLKDRELFICQLQDENKRLKTPSTPPDAKSASAQKKSFLDGLTFFNN